MDKELDREEIRAAAKVMEAYADGKEIQYLDGGEWITTPNPFFNWSDFDYRIKPEPEYRPFRTQEECWEEMLKHQPFGWIKSKDSEEVVQIGRLVKAVGSGCLITLSIDEGRNIAPSYYYNNYTFADGEPFGVEEE